MHNANSIRLKACRKRGGLDQADVSQLVGIRRSSAISRYERARCLPDSRTLIAYEIVFDRPAAKLLPETLLSERRRVFERAIRLTRQCRQTSSSVQDKKLAFLNELILRLRRTPNL